jgi:PadR family transcriptional regulator, regulatory protein PadR
VIGSRYLVRRCRVSVVATGRVSGDVLRGHLDLLVLAVLDEGGGHGYEIAQRLRERSEGVFDVGEGTLYPLLHRLERDHVVASRWQEGTAGPRRRVYRLTGAGQEALAARRGEWAVLTQSVERVLRPATS